MRSTFRYRFGDKQYQEYLAKDPQEVYVPPIPPSRKTKSTTEAASVETDYETSDNEASSEDEPQATVKGKAKLPSPSKQPPPQPQLKKKGSIVFKEPIVVLPDTQTSKAHSSTSSKTTSKPIRPSPTKPVKSSAPLKSSKSTAPTKVTKPPAPSAPLKPSKSTAPSTTSKPSSSKPSKSAPSSVQGEQTKKRVHSVSPPPKPQKKSRSHISPPLSPTFSDSSEKTPDREPTPSPQPAPRKVKKSLHLVDEPTDDEFEKIDSSESGDEVGEKDKEGEADVGDVEFTDADPDATIDGTFDVNTPEFSDAGDQGKDVEEEEGKDNEEEHDNEGETEKDEEETMEKATDKDTTDEQPADKGTADENLPKDPTDEREGHGHDSDRAPSDRQNTDELPPSADVQPNVQDAILTALATISNAQLDTQSTLSKVLENQALMQKEMDMLKRENASLHSQIKTLNSSLIETIKGESASIVKAVKDRAPSARPSSTPSTADQQSSSLVTTLSFADLHEELITQNKQIQKIVAKEVAEAGNAFVKTIITDREEFMTKISKMKTSIKAEVNSSVSASLIAVSESFGPKIEAMKKALVTTAGAHDRTIEDHSGKVDRLFNLTNQSVQEITSKLSLIQNTIDELATAATAPPQGSTNAGFGNTHANEEDGDSYFFPAADSLNYHRRNLNILIPGIDPYFPEYID